MDFPRPLHSARSALLTTDDSTTGSNTMVLTASGEEINASCPMPDSSESDLASVALPL